ncbi:MAG TPA: hypothetical protein PKZ07_03410 [Sedimentisphaerales bacterium]|nr:hypothetical protein [Sedimentisphaerales bacterium]
MRKQFTEELCFLLLFILFILIILVSCRAFVVCLSAVCRLIVAYGFIDVVNPVVQESCDCAAACRFERGQAPHGQMFLRGAILAMAQAAATAADPFMGRILIADVGQVSLFDMREGRMTVSRTNLTKTEENVAKDVDEVGVGGRISLD